MPPAEPGVFIAGQARHHLEPAHGPVPFFILLLHLPVRRQANHHLRAIQPLAAQLVRDVHPVRAHAHCDERVIIALLIRRDDRNIDMNIRRDQLVEHAFITAETAGNKRFKPVKLLTAVQLGRETHGFTAARRGVVSLAVLLEIFRLAAAALILPIGQAHRTAQHIGAVLITRMQRQRLTKTPCGVAGAVEIIIGISHPVMPQVIVLSFLLNRKKLHSRLLIPAQIVVCAREL